ncbi:ABC transporter permease [Ornithinibacillus californiensis]|uniref:ABC transporter permease n=1 Tax=Ornithinibacillus californiensis TaxID=161536 RepID=UPI00064DDCF4|nr:ABC transporter permease [Ornithinibacillus californiensis]
MMDILYTRLLLWKKKSISMLVWLLLPIVGTILFITSANAIQEDSKVPVGIVLEEETALANELVDSIIASELVFLHVLSNDRALYELEKHELDSVFIIHEGFEDAVLSGKRNNIISSYRTELSFAYSPIKEMIVSLVQEETGRAKAANYILAMYERYGGTDPWTWDEITEQSKQKQIDENLLNTAFAYSSGKQADDNPSLLSWNAWGIWAILSLLSTLFLSDWIIREKNLAVSTRYTFIKKSLFSYYSQVIILYVLLIFLFDLLAVAAFTIFLDETISLSFVFVILSFRIMLCMLSISIANLFQRISSYYGISIIIVLLLAIISGIVIPISGFIPQHSLMNFINPLHAFISGNMTIMWNEIGLVSITLALLRKEISNA